MNHTNPIEKMEIPEPVKYPIRVICIVDEYPDAGSALIQAIRTHVHNSGVIFQTRIYDSRRYSDDRDNITRLPAFHVYIQNSYNRTFYPNTRPLQHVNESVEIYLKNQALKKKRKEYISKIYRRFVNWIKTIGKTGPKRTEKPIPFQGLILDWP
jgi:hypothetical protein